MMHWEFVIQQIVWNTIYFTLSLNWLIEHDDDDDWPPNLFHLIFNGHRLYWAIFFSRFRLVYRIVKFFNVDLSMSNTIHSAGNGNLTKIWFRIVLVNWILGLFEFRFVPLKRKRTYFFVLFLFLWRNNWNCFAVC